MFFTFVFYYFNCIRFSPRCLFFVLADFFLQAPQVWTSVMKNYMNILGVFISSTTLSSIAFLLCFIAVPMGPINKIKQKLYFQWAVDSTGQISLFLGYICPQISKTVARKSFEIFCCRLLSYASKAARRGNSEICWQKASRRGCANRTDVLTIHLTMIYLHCLFKYRTDLKLYSRPCAATEWRVQCWNAVSWGNAEERRRPVYTVSPLGQAGR